ncbi:hypothetical protein ACTA71_002039 [Dictyostelium dimigraforme]
MARTKKVVGPPPQTINHNQCFEGDLVITFPLQDSQQPPILSRSFGKELNRIRNTINHLFENATRDRTGQLYKDIVNCIYFNPEAPKHYYDKGSSNNLKYNLIKITEDGSIYIDSLLFLNSHYDQSYLVTSSKVSRSNLYFNKKYIRVPKDVCIETESNFISRLMPGSDIINYKDVKFKIGSYSIFDGPKSSPFIPSFKRICFSTLIQLFSIDKENTLKKIKSLPFDLKEQFIQYCLLEDRPIGYLIIWGLYNDKELFLDEKEKLFPLNVLIGSSLKKDSWLRRNFQLSILDDEYIHDNDSKINVYENYQLFKFKELSSILETKHLLFKSENKSKNSIDDGSPSIVSKEEFLANFHRETRGLFKDEHGNTPEGFLFYGGLILSCLTGQTGGFENSDIDVIMLHDPKETFDSTYIERVRNIFGDDFEDKGYSLHAMGGHVVFSLQYPNRTVQFNIHQFKDVNEVLLGVDIDCSCFAFDGTDVWTLERGLLAVNHRINIASQFSYKIRGENQYQRRLLKYLSRGYDIHYHHTPAIQDIIDHFDTTSGINEYMSGFQLLLAAKYNKEVATSLNQSTKDRSLPYGPEWKKENFDFYLKECFDTVFDGYSSSGVYCPISTIGEMFQYLEYTTEHLAMEDNSWEIPTIPQEFSILKKEKEGENEIFGELPSIEDFLARWKKNEISFSLPSKVSKTE